RAQASRARARSSRGRAARGPRARSYDHPLAREAPVVVVGGARALGGDHAGANRPLGRAGGAEDLALPRLDDALQHLAALAGLRVGHPYAGHREDLLGVEGGVLVAHLEGRVGDEPEAPPLEVRPELNDLVDHLEGLAVPV